MLQFILFFFFFCRYPVIRPLSSSPFLRRKQRGCVSLVLPCRARLRLQPGGLWRQTGVHPSGWMQGDSLAVPRHGHDEHGQYGRCTLPVSAGSGCEANWIPKLVLEFKRISSAGALFTFLQLRGQMCTCSHIENESSQCHWVPSIKFESVESCALNWFMTDKTWKPGWADSTWVNRFNPSMFPKTAQKLANFDIPTLNSHNFLSRKLQYGHLDIFWKLRRLSFHQGIDWGAIPRKCWPTESPNFTENRIRCPQAWVCCWISPQRAESHGKLYFLNS